MGNRSEHEIKCDYLFEQLQKEICEIKERAEKRTGALFKKADLFDSRVVEISSTLKERERAGGSAKDTAVKVGIALFGAFMSIVVVGAIGKIQSLEANISANATANETRWGEHETLIENRDTVQCMSTQSVQVAYNNTEEGSKKPIVVIQCGDGAGM